MPKEFTDCVKNGGKVVTKKLKNNKYIRICYDKKGNPHSGEVMTNKKDKKKAAEKAQIENSKRLTKSLTDLQKYFKDNFQA